MQASDTRTIVQQLMTCVKTLMYSLSKFGNTTPVLTAAIPGGPPVSSFGMREEELRLASKAVVNSVPCLRIFCAPYRNMDREIGIYDLFAEMVSSLPVRAVHCRLCPSPCINLEGYHKSCAAWGRSSLPLVMILCTCTRDFGS